MMRTFILGIFLIAGLPATAAEVPRSLLPDFILESDYDSDGRVTVDEFNAHFEAEREVVAASVRAKWMKMFQIFGKPYKEELSLFEYYDMYNQLLANSDDDGDGIVFQEDIDKYLSDINIDTDYSYPLFLIPSKKYSIFGIIHPVKLPKNEKNIIYSIEQEVNNEIEIYRRHWIIHSGGDPVISILNR